MLKEEIKFLKGKINLLENDLLDFKKMDYMKNQNLKRELKDIRVNNSINSEKLQNREIGNSTGCIVKVENNNKINSNIIFTKGMIIAWYGDIDKIPDNFAICDGSNGTPDLRNKFIIGVCDDKKCGDIGGNSSITLRKSNLPPIGQGYFSCDSHNGSYHHSTNGIIKYLYSYSVSTKNGQSDSWGSNYMIDLNEGMNSSPINIINPYYSLFYIMKL